MKMVRDGRRYMLALEKGEEVLSSIVDFCAREGVRSGPIQGIGSIEDVVIGSYDRTKKSYEFSAEKDVFEVASFLGNITQVDGKPFVHAHAVLSRTDGTNATIGGHLKEARVAVTLELFIISLGEEVRRAMNEDIGLKLIDT